MQLLNLAHSVRRNRMLIVALAGVGFIIGLVLGALQGSVHEATARIAIGPSESVDDVNDRIQVGQVLNRTVVPANLSELLVSRRVLEAAAAANRVSDEELEALDIEATVSPESNVVYLTVTGPDADLPVPMVQEITAAGIELFESIYSVYRAEPIQVDAKPETKDPLPILLSAMIGGLIATILGIYIGLAADKLRVDSAERRLSAVPDETPAATPPPPEHPSSRIVDSAPASNGHFTDALESLAPAIFWPPPKDQP